MDCVKEGIRVLGIDDSPFENHEKHGKKHGKKNKVLVVGVVYRQDIVEGLMSTRITKDGTDSNLQLQRMVNNSKFLPQIKLILLHGTMMAGLNVVDIKKLSKNLHIPIIAITRRKPNMKNVYNALRKSNTDTFERKKRIIEDVADSAGGFHKTTIKGESYYVQSFGLDAKKAANILNSFGIESLRLAHLIGSGIVKGESNGRI